jgi:hypothetical protein
MLEIQNGFLVIVTLNLAWVVCTRMHHGSLHAQTLKTNLQSHDVNETPKEQPEVSQKKISVNFTQLPQSVFPCPKEVEIAENSPVQASIPRILLNEYRSVMGDWTKRLQRLQSEMPRPRPNRSITCARRISSTRR